MRIVLGILVAATTITLANAQTPQQQQQQQQQLSSATINQSITDVEVNWRNIDRSLGQFMTVYQMMAAQFPELQRQATELNALKAYLIACKDQPGCTVPVEPRKE